jgi:hypothetical protein
MRVTNQNYIQEEVRRRLNWDNAWYHSALNIFCSRLMSKNLTIRIFKAITFPVVLHGCESWSLTTRGT